MFEAMRQAGEALGLELHPADPGYFDVYSTVSLTGTYDGVEIVLERQAATYQFSTRALVGAKLPVTFALTRENALHKLANAVGLKDAQLGDAEFDAAFRVVTNDVAGLTKLLTPAVRAELWAFHKAGVSFKVTNLFAEIDRTFMIGELWEGEQVMLDIKPTVAMAKLLRAAGTSGG